MHRCGDGSTFISVTHGIGSSVQPSVRATAPEYRLWRSAVDEKIALTISLVVSAFAASRA